ncbi:hypothetical protein JTE90_025191 [Oedothorax gibbosus]|uniref:Uncharacterized protein n=1 Tax=Oedothorax gibbosus TaxID=931172 RepID=A0AAV6UB30_9ARAC|nr:hypothetical protein JTE90_025191 [Oedothorax gibbosus]
MLTETSLCRINALLSTPRVTVPSPPLATHEQGLEDEEDEDAAAPEKRMESTASLTIWWCPRLLGGEVPAEFCSQRPLHDEILIEFDHCAWSGTSFWNGKFCSWASFVVFLDMESRGEGERAK